MEDLIPFAIFIVIAIANLLKYVVNKGREGQSKPAPPESGAPEKAPASIEDFFESLASKFEPQPTEVADWPEDIERPDYMKEMEEFKPPETAQFEAEETAKIIPMPSTEPVPGPLVRQPSVSSVEMPQINQVASLKSVMKSMPGLLSNSKSMRISSPTILRSSGAGRNDLPLKERATLRQAILANLVFSPPRAYEVEYDNVVIR